MQLIYIFYHKIKIVNTLSKLKVDDRHNNDWNGKSKYFADFLVSQLTWN